LTCKLCPLSHSSSSCNDHRHEVTRRRTLKLLSFRGSGTTDVRISTTHTVPMSPPQSSSSPIAPRNCARGFRKLTTAEIIRVTYRRIPSVIFLVFSLFLRHRHPVVVFGPMVLIYCKPWTVSLRQKVGIKNARIAFPPRWKLVPTGWSLFIGCCDESNQPTSTSKLFSTRVPLGGLITTPKASDITSPSGPSPGIEVRSTPRTTNTHSIAHNWPKKLTHRL